MSLRPLYRQQFKSDTYFSTAFKSVEQGFYKPPVSKLSAGGLRGGIIGDHLTNDRRSKPLLEESEARARTKSFCLDRALIHESSYPVPAHLTIFRIPEKKSNV